MNRPHFDRRRFLQAVAAGMMAGANRFARASLKDRSLLVAALQMSPRLGDVDANMIQAEWLIDDAARRGAAYILLPEMFTSAVAFDERMLASIRPIDGAPARLLRDKARQHGVRIGGSFLASHGRTVTNSFLLYEPDGTLYRHDKDAPTYWEACYYQGGKDDGLLHTRDCDIGVALCWEMIRSRTAARLRGQIQLLLAGSTWWSLPEEAAADHPNRTANLDMLQHAPPTLARLLGVPVVHASHAGRFSGFDSPELPDVAYNSEYLGESMICDANGMVLARRSMAQGAGVVSAHIELPVLSKPLNVVPQRFWLPPQMPEAWKSAWQRWLPRGRDYYDTVTLPYLESGEVEEYVPPYMR